MKILTKYVIKSAGVLATGVFSPVASLPAFAQNEQPVIINTASAEWDAGAQRISVRSNTVQFTVEPRSPQTGVTLYRISGGPGASTHALPPTMCSGNAGRVAMTLGGAYADVPLSSASLLPTTTIRAGEPLVIGVTAPGRNVNPAAIDSFDAVIATPNGDRERISFTETAPNSGTFLGFINTKAIPPTPVAGDCALSVNPGDTIDVELDDASNGTAVGHAGVEILVDPFGLTFDSGDGAPVDGTRVTIVDATTGQPAQVFGDDGVSAFPNSLITGSTVTDASGHVYAFTSGFYRFPFLRRGTYRLIVTPPGPYRFPSVASPAEIAALTRPDGGAFVIADGSYGGTITLFDPAPVRVDVPLDRPGSALSLRKTTSTVNAVPGDIVQYRISVENPDRTRVSGPVMVTDTLPDALRLRKNTLKYQGNSVTATVSPDGSRFTVTLPPLAGGGKGLLTYLAEVKEDARPGSALNVAFAQDNRGTQSDVADAAIRIVKDGITERFTLIGRVMDGGCDVNPRKSKGIAGVRVMLQDGTYTVTDQDGRYHFEGLVPGIHVVQVDPGSFPLDLAPVDCARNTRSAGSAISRFVEGMGGSLKRADFRAKVTAARVDTRRAATPLPPVLTDPQAAGAERDWFVGQTVGTGFLYPDVDHNPRVKSLRVAVKHRADQTVELLVNGKRASALNYDGTKKNADGQILAAIWRGVNIEDGENKLVANIKDSAGNIVEVLERSVYFARAPMKAQFIKEQSILVADGVTRPRIVVRLTDRTGKPVQHGSVGDFRVSDPYRPAVETDAEQANQLSGLERAAPVWRVSGDNGLAYIELEPTTASGTVAISFNFIDGEVRREQRVETWLDPGNRPWTVVGFAAGTIGFNKLEQGLEALSTKDDPINVDGRIALYAKGRVTGKWLMTMAYDSDKKEDETRFAGIIDPRRYYTIYADGTDQRYDAASVRRLYLKLERPQFYALFGDYQTGIDEPELARYQRSFNGVKAEYRNDEIQATAFGSDTPYRFRREEIQGNGLSGPYMLASRDIIANSERIRIETRDRLRSERIVETKSLLRHIDYDIDYLSGSIRFREPVLSRASNLDPQFIIAEYEVDGIGKRVANAGGRVRWTSADEKLQIAATGIHDETDTAKTDLVGADIIYRPGTGTEIRAEFAGSSGQAKSSSIVPAAGGATAWLVEAEHHDEKFDVLAYVREQQAGFGVGQQNRSEVGTRKFGVDGRVRLTDQLSASLIAYQEEFFGNDARRRAAIGELEYRSDDTTFRAGLTHASDKLSDGSVNQSTLARLGASQRFFDGKLELSAQTEFALGDQDESVDFPARHNVSARYQVASGIALVAGYEIAKGENIDARTARVGFDVAPWTGARILASANQQQMSEFGPRTYAAYGLAQSFRISEKWSVDLTLDGNKTLGGIDRADVVNPDQPVSSGGFLGSAGLLTEDFNAVTAGATYRGDRWSWTGRAEYRDGETTNRYGLTTAILRQIGEGRAVGGAISWFRAKEIAGAQTTTAQAEISWAHRPSDSQWSLLNKTELRYDAVRDAVAGTQGPVGGALLNIDGDAKSRRVINSLSVNYTPVDEDEGSFIERGEYTLFWGTRYATDRFGQDDVKGWSNVIGADLKFDLSDVADIGAAGTVRIGSNGKNIAYSGGPVLTVTPFKNANISMGYNVVGFEDRDFEEARYTRSGPFITLKLKFDQTSLAGFKF
jgi:uncharacterized repeat protein (TIGR01451 family)